LVEVGPIRSSPYPAIYVGAGSATHSAQPVAKGTSPPQSRGVKSEKLLEKDMALMA